jgi:hypothetical protein
MRDDIKSTNAIRLGLDFIAGLSDDDTNIIVWPKVFEANHRVV